MKRRRLGKTELDLSVLGMGCSMLGRNWPRSRCDNPKRLLSAAFDRGVNFFDTADIYSQGNSERLLGQVFGSFRQKVIISTKSGYRIGMIPATRRKLSALRGKLPFGQSPSNDAPSIFQSFDKNYIAGSIENSLRCLKTDFIDLFLLHSPPPVVAEDDSLFETLNRLKQQGKIRYFGVSCRTLEHAKVFIERQNISAVQVMLNLGNIDKAQELLEYASSDHIGLIARQLFSGRSLEIARQYTVDGMSEFRIALQGVVKYSDVTSALTGFSNIEHMKENANSVDRV